jgi:titin
LGNFDGWIDEVVVRSKRATVPASPSGLSVAAVSASSTSLSWTDASANETGFRIYRSTNNIVFDECGEVASGVTSWNDSGLRPLSQYYYSVTAFNAAGESLAVSGGVQTTGNVLAAPTGLIGVQEKNQLHIIWNAQPGATGYNIKRGLTSAGPFTIVGTTSDSTSFLDPNVVAGITYYYSVSAVSAAGESPNSEAYALKCISVPSSPSLLRLRQALPTQVTIMWRDTSVNEVGFVIERSMDGVAFTALAKAAANNSIFDDWNVVPGTTYYYRLRSFNTAGSSGYSNIISATTPSN